MPHIPRTKDLCLAFTIGPWGGFHMKWWSGLRIWSLNLGFIGIRAWRGDLPSKIVIETARILEATQKEFAQQEASK